MPSGRGRRRAVVALVLITVAVVAACASTGERSGRNMDELSREQITRAGARDLYDLIQRERPRWLSVRGQRSFGLETGVVVFQDRTLLGAPDVLRSMSPGIAWRIEYMDGPKASATLSGLGSRHVEGAIVIHTSPDR